ncbi:MAG: hypothetical protein F4W90_07615 [Gammaproteobacteria bacterium]|nr:hypothetical protein [Gammaproteobacteria bacterium]
MNFSDEELQVIEDAIKSHREVRPDAYAFKSDLLALDSCINIQAESFDMAWEKLTSSAFKQDFDCHVPVTWIGWHLASGEKQQQEHVYNPMHVMH